jgi:hypothetical protein
VATKAQISGRISLPRAWALIDPMPWSTPLEDPIDLPRGRQLVTLQDAADFILEAAEG